MNEQTDIGQAGQVRRSEPRQYPVREYIASMGRELAQMARWDGDEGLAALLEAVEERALGQPPDAQIKRSA